jgi:hypothetical protein
MIDGCIHMCCIYVWRARVLGHGGLSLCCMCVINIHMVVILSIELTVRDVVCIFTLARTSLCSHKPHTHSHTDVHKRTDQSNESSATCQHACVYNTPATLLMRRLKYIHAYICMHVYIYMYIDSLCTLPTHVFIHAFLLYPTKYIRTQYIRTHTCVYSEACMHAHAHTHINTYLAGVCIYVPYILAYIHTCLHRYAHTYMHTLLLHRSWYPSSAC